MFCILLASPLFAQYIASDISFTHLSGTSYGILVRVFTTEPGTLENSCQVLFCDGDGDTTIADRINGPSGSCNPFHQGMFLSLSLFESVYYGEHTFPGPGTYTLCYSAPNRPGGICNILASATTPGYVKAELVIDSVAGANSSPVYTTLPLNYDTIGIISYYNPSVTEPDGDSLYYELVSPMENGIAIPGYTTPATSSTFSIDHATGTVTWDAPVSNCTYYYDIKISEWRHPGTGAPAYYIGSTMQDILNWVSNPTGIVDPGDTDLHLFVYPNPSESTLLLDFDTWEHGSARIEIINTLGQQVLLTNNTSFSTGHNNTSVDIQSLPPGVYFVKLAIGTQRTAQRFVKR